MAPRNRRTSRTRNSDGWTSALAGLSKRSDKSKSVSFGATQILSQVELSQVWHGEGIASRAVSCVAEDMTRAWISLQDDGDGAMASKLDSLKAEQSFHEAITWMRLYGGSVILVGSNDSPDLEKPRSAKPKDITFLKVYPRDRVTIYSTDIVTDPRSPYFDEPEFLTIQKLDGTTFRVHRTRCLVFHGIPFATNTGTVSWEDRYWGMSALQQPWEQLKTLGSSFQAVANILLEFNIGVFKLSNLSQLLASGNDDAIYRRMEVISASKSIINSVLLGDTEDFRRDVAGVSGLDDLLDRFMMATSGVTGIPVTRLFGKSAGGLNSTGEGELTQYYDSIESAQKNKVRPPLQELLNQLNVAMGGAMDENVPFIFNPLWTPSQPELIEMRSKQAATDEKYLTLGVLLPEEVRQSRFENGYSFETAIDPNATPDASGTEAELLAQIASLEAQLAEKE